MAVDPEIDAMGAINVALSPLEDEARARVIRWVAERYGVAVGSGRRPAHPKLDRDEHEDSHGGDDEVVADLPSLFDRANPQTNLDRALVVAYWLQEHEGREAVASQEVNTHLKNFGHGVRDITTAFSGLMEKTPKLVIQIRKQGSTRQARKQYKVTEAGKKYVRRMVAGRPDADDE